MYLWPVTRRPRCIRGRSLRPRGNRSADQTHAVDRLDAADSSAVSSPFWTTTPPPKKNSHRATITRFTVTGGVNASKVSTRNRVTGFVDGRSPIIIPFPCRVASSCIRCLRTRCAGLPVTSLRPDATSRCSSTTRPDVRPDSSTITRRPAVPVVPTRKNSPWRAAAPADKPWWSAALTGLSHVPRNASFTGTGGRHQMITLGRHFVTRRPLNETGTS